MWKRFKTTGRRGLRQRKEKNEKREKEKERKGTITDRTRTLSCAPSYLLGEIIEKYRGELAKDGKARERVSRLSKVGNRWKKDVIHDGYGSTRKV